MKPDFSKPTVELLAKRSAYRCSNPDCRVVTVGPNDDVKKATIIGEAAHIYGARPGSKRYLSNMTDISRAEITNAIWLCRNCHKLIDSDETRFTAELLFSWRGEHENYLLEELGNKSDKLILESNNTKLEPFRDYPPVISIVLDEPPGWEWRLASELLKFLIAPEIRKLEDLQNKLYTRPLKQIELVDFPKWIMLKFEEFKNLVQPFEKLLDRLTVSFGKPGEKGDQNEIHYACKLIKDFIEQVIIFEESVNFVYVPGECERTLALFRNLMGSQASKLKEIPVWLDEAVDIATNDDSNGSSETKIINKVIKLEVGDNWSNEFTSELKLIYKLIHESES